MILIFVGNTVETTDATSEGEDEVSVHSAAEDGEEADDGEEVEVEDGKVASKKWVMLVSRRMRISSCLPSAKAALAKREDVDIEGGWKVGDPYAPAILTRDFR